MDYNPTPGTVCWCRPVAEHPGQLVVARKRGRDAGGVYTEVGPLNHLAQPQDSRPTYQVHRSYLRQVSHQQLKVLAHVLPAGMTVRVDGGFWTVPEMAVAAGVTKKAPFAWWNVQTVRALEKAGILRRMNVFPEEWRDSREVVR